MKLPGLTADTVAGLIATYGLYEVLPDARIRWISDNGGVTYYPEVEAPGFDTVDALARHLLKEDTWNRLHLIARNGNRFTVEDFAQVFDKDQEMATALACDGVTELKDNQILVKKSPLIMARRNSVYRASLAYVNSEFKRKPYFKKLKIVTENLDDLVFNLTHDYSSWRMTEGNGFGFFPFEMFRAYRPMMGEDDIKQERITAFTMLCLIAMRSMPTYFNGRIVTIAPVCEDKIGKGKKTYIYLPIWDKWFDKDDHRAWMFYPELSKKQAKDGLRKFGIVCVLRCPFLKGAKGYGFESISTPV